MKQPFHHCLAKYSPNLPFLHIYRADNCQLIHRDLFMAQTAQAAAWLYQRQIRPDSRVVLAVSDELVWLWLFFGAVRLGAVPVLVNPQDTAQLRQIWQEDLAQFVCVDTPMLARELGNSARLLVWEGRWPTVAAQSLPGLSKNDDDLLLAIYTSGSTGRPKYVEKSYRNIGVELEFLARLLPLSAADSVFSIVPVYHIYGLLFGLLLPLMVGARMFFSQKLLPGAVGVDAEHSQANILVAAPIHYQTFLDSPVSPSRLPQLQLAISSGAPLSAQVAHNFCRQNRTHILELYGSTETGGIAYRRWSNADQPPAFAPFPYIEIAADDNASLSGELIVASPAISKNIRPTADDPWYTTGDIVTFVAGVDKIFNIVGRESHIIKAGGKRISTIQLEEELKKIPQVLDAAIIRVPADGLRGECAHGVIELRQSGQLTPLAIKKALQTISSHSAVVQKITIVDKIPRKPNGKLDGDKLPRAGAKIEGLAKESDWEEHES